MYTIVVASARPRRGHVRPFVFLSITILLGVKKKEEAAKDRGSWCSANQVWMLWTTLNSSQNRTDGFFRCCKQRYIRKTWADL